MSKKYTLAVCTLDINSSDCKRLFASMKYLDKSRYDLIVIDGKNNHDYNLNMAIDACRTPYIIFVDDDTEYEEKHKRLFDNLDSFWAQHKWESATVQFCHCDANTYPVVDCTNETPYHCFCHCCYNLRVGIKFFDVWEGNQCNDIAWLRALRYAGWKNYGAEFMNLLHHVKTNKSPERMTQIERNKELAVEIFGCATDAAPERSGGWERFEHWLIKRYGCIPFRKREEIVLENSGLF